MSLTPFGYGILPQSFSDPTRLRIAASVGANDFDVVVAFGQDLVQCRFVPYGEVSVYMSGSFYAHGGIVCLEFWCEPTEHLAYAVKIANQLGTAGYESVMARTRQYSLDVDPAVQAVIQAALNGLDRGIRECMWNATQGEAKVTIRLQRL